MSRSQQRTRSSSTSSAIIPSPLDIFRSCADGFELRYSGVCHTDLHALNGDWPVPTKLPLVGGHEGAGVVVAKGDLVEGWEL